MRDEYRRWFREGIENLEIARILCREKKYNSASFYSQQAAEMVAKALLFKFNEHPWGHSIRELLLRYAAKLNIMLEKDLLDCARELDRHYIPSRYPNAHPSGTSYEAYDEKTALNAIQCAEIIINYVKSVLYGNKEI
ncbi:MAG: HEPN domain-containing protein [Candidatus Helarchaeota archaeon]